MQNKQPMEFSLQVEHFLLGSILVEGAGQPKSNILPKVAAIVKPDDFHDSRLRAVYETMLTIDGPLNEVTVAALLPGSYAGICPYLISVSPTYLDWESYAHVVAGHKPKTLPQLKGGAI